MIGILCFPLQNVSSISSFLRPSYFPGSTLTACYKLRPYFIFPQMYSLACSWKGNHAFPEWPHPNLEGFFLERCVPHPCSILQGAWLQPALLLQLSARRARWADSLSHFLCRCRRPSQQRGKGSKWRVSRRCLGRP